MVPVKKTFPAIWVFANRKPNPFLPFFPLPIRLFLRRRARTHIHTTLFFQSTVTPIFRKSVLASSISPMSSLYASGQSLKVRTPQPRLPRRYAPRATRAQNGSYREVRGG